MTQREKDTVTIIDALCYLWLDRNRKGEHVILNKTKGAGRCHALKRYVKKCKGEVD